MAAATNAAVEFTADDWRTVGRLTGCSDIIVGHSRLLRALSWGDPDVPDNAVEVLNRIVALDPDNLDIVENYIADPEGATTVKMVSTVKGKGPVITFRPGVFEVPSGDVDPSLVAVMMPFTPQFEPVFDAIHAAAKASGGSAVRVKDIWEHSTIIQDVFALIFRAQVVVCDFTGKNPNVFYEAGIAHTLGKIVVPITQSHEDVPFDVRHHRYLHYLGNTEGLTKLTAELTVKLRGDLKIPF